ALIHSGGLNAGTPSEMASTPVSAAPPEANARSMRNSVSGSSALWTGVGSPGGPNPKQTRPQPSRAAMHTRNAYVGSMKMLPLSRIPRRLMSVMSTMTTTPISALKLSSAGYADASAFTPAATDTATVNV